MKDNYFIMRFLVFAGALILAEGATQGFVPIAGILGAYDNVTPTTSPLRIELTTAPNFVVDSTNGTPGIVRPLDAEVGG